MKTTVGAFCFAEEKAKKNAEVIDQVSRTIHTYDTILIVDSCSSLRKA
jgi:hypothetical protein